MSKEKKVLVIEDWEKFRKGWLDDTLDLDKCSPGRLLASVSGNVLKTEIENYQKGHVKMVTIHNLDLLLENPEKSKVTVLFLEEK